MHREASRVILVRGNSLLVMSRDKFGQKYYSLIGGGVDAGENREQALIREVKEEAGLSISDPKLVYIEDAPLPFGTQYIYSAADPGGKIALSEDSQEHKINQLRKNLYEPMWLSINQLPKVAFLSTELKKRLIIDLDHGFGPDPVRFTSSAIFETDVQLKEKK